MKTAVTFLFALLLSVSLEAQRPVYAPDFGLVNEYGDTLYLQEDLLDNNMTVVLAFFGVGCVSCANAVPTLDSLYNHYGQNQNNVYLWAIEPSQVYDYDAVDSWLNENNASYPGYATTAEDSVTELYNIYLTPKYFVICPDGSMRDYSLENVPAVIENCLTMVDVETPEVYDPSVYATPGALLLNGTRDVYWQLRVYSMTGKQVYSRSGRGDNRMPVSLNEGLYIYRLSDEDGKVYTGKFLMP
ncbi:MAG TPA: redoxin family protein [Bacteroidales bacterium]|nr:redoxin family protein [Bacteroidales bacterium]